jgi:SNF2 family DNA or RNA helicase
LAKKKVNKKKKKNNDALNIVPLIFTEVIDIDCSFTSFSISNTEFLIKQTNMFPKVLGKVFNETQNLIQTILLLNEEFPKNDFNVELSELTKINKPFLNFNIFDAILPVLQPPLNSNFESELTLHRTLRPYQIEGVKFLYSSKNALLGDEMGLGKSIQTITAARFLFRKGEISSACIICPLAVVSDWEEKIKNWAPELRVIKVIGDKTQRKLLWNSPAHFFICTYEGLRNDIEFTSQSKGVVILESGHEINCPNSNCNRRIISKYSEHYKEQICSKCKVIFNYPNNTDIARTSFDLVILDEVQKTKKTTSGLTKAVRTIYSNYKWTLSGTPLENSIEDLISICETTKAGIFSKVDKFDNKEIVRAYKSIFLRRIKKDVLDEIPDLVHEDVQIELTSAQRIKYDKAEKDGIIDLEGKGNNLNVQHALALITKLKQICNYDPETNESAKLQYLLNDLEIIKAQGDKAIVFSQYPNETLTRILPYLEEYNAKIYDGSLSDSARTKIVSDFQTNSAFTVLLVSLKSGNAGITLTGANYVYHFDLWWNPAIIDQATARAHRFGQKKTVHEKYLLAQNTIENKIYDILKRKKLEFHEIVDGLNDINVLIKSMSEDEIFGLFGLSKKK